VSCVPVCDLRLRARAHLFFPSVWPLLPCVYACARRSEKTTDLCDGCTHLGRSGDTQRKGARDRFACVRCLSVSLFGTSLFSRACTHVCVCALGSTQTHTEDTSLLCIALLVSVLWARSFHRVSLSLCVCETMYVRVCVSSTPLSRTSDVHIHPHVRPLRQPHTLNRRPARRALVISAMLTRQCPAPATDQDRLGATRTTLN